MPLIRPHRQNSGFTLVEMAMVLMIAGLLLGALMMPLAIKMEQEKLRKTKELADSVSEALIGFAMVHDRLPCPATASSRGAESFAGAGNESNGACSQFNNGFVPAVTLGLSTVDDEGYVIDGWGNRMRYAITAANSNAYTKINGINLSASADLVVCSVASASTSTCSVANTILASNVPAVIYSTGKNGGYGGTQADEAENPNPNRDDNDRIFVSHPPTSSASSSGEFDDYVIWLSPNILFHRLIAAGRLP